MQQGVIRKMSKKDVLKEKGIDVKSIKFSENSHRGIVSTILESQSGNKIGKYETNKVVLVTVGNGENEFQICEITEGKMIFNRKVLPIIERNELTLVTTLYIYTTAILRNCNETSK